MFPEQIPKTNPDAYSRCEERRRATDHGKSLSPIQKAEAALKESIYRAFWKDDILRAIEYGMIDVYINKGTVHLYGHIVSATSQIRVMNAIRTITSISSIKNHLVLDDKLTLAVANSLGKLEHIYNCKFFTGASHGVISLSGIVPEEDVKLLAEQYAARNPNVRGVINHIRVKGSELESQNQPFLQPTIGETIYFLDWISGIVKQVIINPNNRRVIAMTVQGRFTDQQYEFNSLTDNKGRLPEQLVIVPMSTVRYMTRESGFLHIRSNEKNQYPDFDSTSFTSPGWGWIPPYPYCLDDVLYPVEQQGVENHILEQVPQPLFIVASKEQVLWEQLLADDNLGG